MNDLRLSSVSELEEAAARARGVRDAREAEVLVCAGTGCLANGSAELKDALGEEIQAGGLEAKVEMFVKRTGCHGFCEKGPLVVIRPGGVCYQRVKVTDAKAIVEKTLVGGEVIERLTYKDPNTKERIEKREDIPFYARQKRVALRRSGSVDPTDIEDCLAEGGYRAMAKAFAKMTPDDVIDEVTRSGLRGRGGAGFPAGRKWRACRDAEGEPRHVVCNAGGLAESDPHAVLEGMAIGAYAVGASLGHVFIREEYPLALERVSRAVEQARERGLLGEDILGTGFDFDLRIVLAGGGFVAGESSAVIKSLAGEVGEPRAKYVRSAVMGLNGCPTVLNNVETWANVPLIIERGADAFRGIGTESSPGTKVLALGGRVKNTGIVEVPLGTSLRDIVCGAGGGVSGDRALVGIQIGGPSGGFVPTELLDTELDFDSLAALGSIMGNGGLVVMDDRTCVLDVARYFTHFLAEESCGKCAPCREGVPQLYEMLNEICEGRGEPEDLDKIRSLAEVVARASLCGLGKTAPNPVLTALRHFGDDIRAHIEEKKCPAGVCRALTTFQIDAELCNGCRVCAKNCPMESITGERKETHVINVEICDRCGICRSVCPSDAVVAV